MTSEVAMQDGRHKILIIDDTPANIQILNEFLRQDYAIFFSTNGPDGIRIARQELPDLILLDIMMPKMDGYEVCAKIKADPLTRQIPVIFITAMNAEEDEAKGLDAGAIDYITKPVSAPIVKARVKNHLELKRHRDELKKLTIELDEKNQELNMLARKDALTGLANRRHFDEVLDAELKRASRSSQLLSLILCDVDFFKSYNDHYGHVAGDKCLQAIGKVLRQNFKRISDLPARYGGEEFAVIFPDTPPGSAGQLAEKLRLEMIAQAIPHAFSAAAEFVTLSFGVVGALPTGERNADWFINAADKALYQAKENGRNQVVKVDYL
ncbi:MAG TPA: diguanylate cyclase [Geobacteraceae bacterium]|nr:diguanylate cyclase [Geobacteraceae bacterium]